ncbi:flagellar biosynthesis anti-sigma factor FlgM [Bacillus sp. 03113]|uniref:flagellar biosynthesis anti-sigma factor FlgM n=1 Tax=Bacillus sp. 03113 TaxID=2578211 RepID=UPI001141ADE8|nr:flagellar biosynthesis anti-sigma factor FlgM [Bacillus sp. 03113]
MKINNFGPSGMNPYQKQLRKQALEGSPSGKKGTDKVEISTTAKEMQHESTFALKRQEKVEALKHQVEKGTYKMDPYKVAQSMYRFYSSKH